MPTCAAGGAIDRSAPTGFPLHRDLKPANVVIAEEAGGPQAKLLDFGVASLADPRGGQAAPGAKPAAVGGPSEVGILLGTPMYLAPELAEGSHLASPASDIFSFGVIAFELMTRFLPFAQPPVVTRYRKERLAVSALLKVRPDLAQAFADRNQALLVTGLVERCLSEDTAARPSAGEIASVLGAAAISVTVPVAGLHHSTSGSGRGEPA